MTCNAVQSAAKALDYYDGFQIKWLERVLDGEADTYSDNLLPSQSTNLGAGGIKNWRERGVYPWYTNITKKIIDRSALSYQKPPERAVMVNGEKDENATEIYLDILRRGEFDAVMDAADSVCRLLKNVIVLAQSVDVDGEEKVMFSVLHRGNCDIDYDFRTGHINSLMYQSCGCGPHGGKLFHYWDAEGMKDIEASDGDMRVVGQEAHGYNTITAAVLWDTHKPRAGFWPKCAWEELIRCNEGINLFHTEVKFNERFQAFPALFSDADIPGGTIIGPDAVVQIKSQPGEPVYLEYKAATAVNSSLAAFEEWLAAFESGIADGWGVNLRGGGSGGADSGFKLVVEEIWNLETRNDRLKAATQFERDMYHVILSISNARGFGLPEGSELYVKFPKPSLPVNAKEAWDIKKEQIALDYISIEDAWREEEPDITQAEIDRRWESIKTENTATLPTFGGVIGEQQPT
jgi:hypothetical protein